MAPPVFGLTGVVSLTPLLVGATTLIALSVVRQRQPTLRDTARAVWEFLPRLVTRVRPAYWWALCAIALAAERFARLPWTWPLAF